LLQKGLGRNFASATRAIGIYFSHRRKKTVKNAFSRRYQLTNKSRHLHSSRASHLQL
jgi:hypothetical protein